MNTITKILSLVFVMTHLLSCEIINPAEDIPMYIEIDSVNFSTDLLTEGTSSHKITDAWVYVNGDLIGMFEIPATVPVLASGNKNLTILAGIMDNGNSTTRENYPFYSSYNTTMAFAGQKNVKVTPVFTYRGDLTFEIIEDFELGVMFVNNSGTAVMTNTKDSSLVFEGSRSAVVKLDDVNSVYEGITSDKYSLPGGSMPVYIELNYKCSQEFFFGLKVTPPASLPFQLFSHRVNTKSYWNKIYLNITDQVSTYNGTYGPCEFQVLIRAEKFNSADTTFIYLDNVKLIY